MYDNVQEARSPTAGVTSTSIIDASKRSGKWYNPVRARPTHFIAVRLVSREIRRRIQQVQQWFIAKDPLFERCLVPLKKLHVALLLTSIAEDRVSEACDACKEAGQRVREHLGQQPLSLIASGVGHFGDRVLFTRIRAEPFAALQRVHDILTDVFWRRGFPVFDETTKLWKERGQESARFIGHSSFLKVSKAMASSRNAEEKKALSHLRPAEADFSQMSTFFGVQMCTEFELLSMLGSSSDGYYPSLQLEYFSTDLQTSTSECVTGDACCEKTANLERPSQPIADTTEILASMRSDVFVDERPSSSSSSAVVTGLELAQSTETTSSKRYRTDYCRNNSSSDSQQIPLSFSPLSNFLFADMWPSIAQFLLLQDVIHTALTGKATLNMVQEALRGVRACLFSVGAGRSSSWEGSCRDWDRRGSGEEHPLAIVDGEDFLNQAMQQAILWVELAFAEDAQDELFGKGMTTLCAAIRQTLPVCLGVQVDIVIDSIRNISMPSLGTLSMLRDVQPRVLGVECVEVSDISDWINCIGALKHAQVLVHAWMEICPSGKDEETWFSKLLQKLPATVRGLDFQNLNSSLHHLPVCALPLTLKAFGTIVLQCEVNGCSERGSIDFSHFKNRFPIFPSSVRIVRASIGTDQGWSQPAHEIADTFLVKFPGLSIFQVEFSLRPSFSSSDVPFVGLADVLVRAGVKVEVTSIRSKPAQYEYLRAALDHAGAAVRQNEEGDLAVWPFSHPSYIWPPATLSIMST